MSFPTKNSGMVNIPRKISDEFYRYKMPILRAKIEGRGNGMKTRVENMAEIAQALGRSPEYTTKFLGYELGALTHIDPKRNSYLVNGRHSPEALSEKLDEFINKFLLCALCGNPETDMHVKTKPDSINLRCRACGALTAVDTSLRLASYILKHPPEKKSTSAVSVEGTSSQDQFEIDSANAASDKDILKDWPKQDVAPEAVERRRREMFGDSAAPDDLLGNLKKFFESSPTSSEITVELRKFTSEYVVKESSMTVYAFSVLFDHNFTKQIENQLDVLKAIFPTQKEQKYLLYSIELLCSKFPFIIKSMSAILDILYENEILDEEIILKWEKYPSKHLDSNTSKQIRESARKFITWLVDSQE